MLIGVISDTHGVLPRAATDALTRHDLDLIVHAGDVGVFAILEQLEQIAPVIAVRGNCDFRLSLLKLPSLAEKVCGNTLLVITHRPESLEVELRRPRYGKMLSGRGESSTDASAQSAQIVGIHGHTHLPYFKARESANMQDVYLLCPGSPVEPRGGSKASVAILTLGAAGTDVLPSAEFIEV